MHSIFSSASLAVALAATMVQGHMKMTSPAPFRAKTDYDMVAPLKPDGSNYPCKGYLSDLGTEAGASVVTWSAGGPGSVTISGGASHGGGSCQISLSYDQGKSFTVIKSFIGDCPTQGESKLDFTIPDDAPTGAAVLSWTWNNKLGNPELYQNCASITISGGSAKRRMAPRAAVAYSSRPQVFLSNINNGCKTEGMVIDYPNPGPDVSRQGSDAKAPSCDGGAGSAPGGGSGGGSPAPSSQAPPAASSTQASATSATSTKAASTTTTPGGVFIPQPTGGSGTQPTGAPAASSSATPTTTTGAPATNPTGTPGSGSGNTEGALSGACSEEGAWNCIGGSSFQRCASGAWSTPQALAAGTKCTAGKADVLALSRKARRGGARRFSSPWDGAEVVEEVA